MYVHCTKGLHITAETSNVMLKEMVTYDHQMMVLQLHHQIKNRPGFRGLTLN